jgi:glutaredoxin
MVKKYLNSKGAQYDEVNIDEQPERQKDAYELSGQLSVPITVVTKQDDSRQIVVGYNLAQLAPALG